MACVFRQHCGDCVAIGRSPDGLLADRRCLTCPAPHELHVSQHALDRVRERDPARGWITALRSDVLGALREGRASELPPPWASRSAKRGHAYAWPPEGGLVFVLVRGRRGGVVVKTVLALAEQAAA